MFCETQKILFFWRGEAGEKKEGNHGCQQVLFASEAKEGIAIWRNGLSLVKN